MTKHGAYAPLLMALLGLFIVDPMMKGHLGNDLFVLMVTAVLLSAAWLSSQHRHQRWIALCTAALSSASLLVGSYSGSHSLLVLGFSLTSMQTGYATTLLLRDLVTRSAVSLDAIYQGVCGYLLLGLMWSLIFALLEIAEPGSFQDEGVSLEEVSQPFGRLLYLSFVTLSTLGYGDVLPVTALSRSLAILEALSGQLYLAILISGLVARYLADRRAR